MKRYALMLGVAMLLSASPALGADVSSATEEETRWTMINVTPAEDVADCHLIEFSDGRKAMIDVGDGGGGRAALTFLQSRKITHIDLVVISHFHRDHYGRLVDLIEAGIKVDRVAMNMPAPGNKTIDGEIPWGFDRAHAQSVLQYLSARQIPYFTPKAGERLLEVAPAGGPTASLDVVCLYDGVHTPVGETDTNDTSIIVRLSVGPVRALFTGDLNSALGAWLARSTFDLTADVLKVPHHGTEGVAPNEFFARVNPKAALVPSPKALWRSERSKRIRDYFSEHHIPTYVSGIHGHVTVVMTTRGFTIETEHPE
jgi:competence protein ComEC